jgi:hypothetical protein
VVKPLFGLPSPYRLSVAQRQQRRAPPKGERKWTKERQAAAVEGLAQGIQPEPLKRARPAGGEPEQEPEVEAEGEGVGGEEGDSASEDE